MSKHCTTSANGWVKVCRDVSALRAATSDGPIIGPREVWETLRLRAAENDQESFYVFALDARMRARGVEEVARGAVNSTPIYPREIFRAAIVLGAAKVIVAHNHPAGSLRPSSADRAVTRSIVAAGDLLDIPVVDHVIVTEEGYFSFAEAEEL